MVGIDCFSVGRLRETHGAIWQLTAIDVYSSYAWAELVICPNNNPTAAQTSKLARRVGLDLRDAGWKLERVLSDNGNEFRGRPFAATSSALRPATRAFTPGARRPTATSKRCTIRSLTNAGGQRSRATHATPVCAANSTPTCTSTTTTASTTAASPYAASPHTSSTMPAKWSLHEPNLPAHLRNGPH
jgi:hypothetical protein